VEQQERTLHDALAHEPRRHALLEIVELLQLVVAQQVQRGFACSPPSPNPHTPSCLRAQEIYICACSPLGLTRHLTFRLDPWVDRAAQHRQRTRLPSRGVPQCPERSASAHRLPNPNLSTVAVRLIGCRGLPSIQRHCSQRSVEMEGRVKTVAVWRALWRAVRTVLGVGGLDHGGLPALPCCTRALTARNSKPARSNLCGALRAPSRCSGPVLSPVGFHHLLDHTHARAVPSRLSTGAA
jgi:hypothetical protein